MVISNTKLLTGVTMAQVSYGLRSIVEASKGKAFTALIVFASIIATDQAHATSIDCATTSNSIEQTICDSDEVSDLDNQLQEAYSLALGRSQSVKMIKAQQDTWVSNIRNQCNDENCLIITYSQRIKELRDQIRIHNETPTVASGHATVTQAAIHASNANTATISRSMLAPDQQMDSRDPAKVTTLLSELARNQNSETPPKTDSKVGTVILFTWLGITVAGVITGWSASVTVFRNYDDLVLVFFGGLAFLAANFLMADSGQNTLPWLIIAALTAMGLFAVILVRTWVDNPSIIKFPVALVTKLSLSVLFLVHLLELLNPSGKTQVERAKNRASALIVLLILSPVINRLVRDKEGIWVPQSVLNKYQRDKLKL